MRGLSDCKGIRFLFVAGCVLTIVGCATEKQSTRLPLGRIAMAPGGGVLADGVALELVKRGYEVIDAQQIQTMVATTEYGDAAWSKPETLSSLKAKGIQSVITVKSTTAWDSKPESASAKIVDAASGRIVRVANWGNGGAGAPFSPMYAWTRGDVTAAAQELTAYLLGEETP